MVSATTKKERLIKVVITPTEADVLTSTIAPKAGFLCLTQPPYKHKGERQVAIKAVEISSMNEESAANGPCTWLTMTNGRHYCVKQPLREILQQIELIYENLIL